MIIALSRWTPLATCSKSGSPGQTQVLYPIRVNSNGPPAPASEGREQQIQQRDWFKTQKENKEGQQRRQRRETETQSPTTDSNSNKIVEKIKNVDYHALLKDILPPNCFLSKGRGISLENDKSREELNIIDKSYTLSLQFNLLKIINSLSYKLLRGDHSSYLSSASYFNVIDCIGRSHESPMSHLKSIELFKDNFMNVSSLFSDAPALITDMFMLGGKGHCLMFFPSPILYQSLSSCQNIADQIHNKLRLPPLSMQDWTIPEGTVQPVYVTLDGLTLDPPGHTICNSPASVNQVFHSNLLTEFQKINSSLFTIDQIMETEFSQALDQLLESCSLPDSTSIINDGIDISDLESCHGSHRNKRDLSIINLKGQVNGMGDQAYEKINLNFQHLHSNQEELDKELGQIKLSSKLLFAIQSNLESHLDNIDGRIRGNTASSILRASIQQQLQQVHSLCKELILDSRIFQSTIEKIISAINSRFAQTLTCHNGACAERDDSSFYTPSNKNKLVQVATARNIFSKDLDIIKCFVNREGKLPIFANAIVKDLNTTSMTYSISGKLNTISNSCIKTPDGCALGLNRKLRSSELIHGIYIIVQGSTVYSQCLEETVLIDREGAKVCNMNPVKTIPPAHVPTKNISITSSSLFPSSVSIPDHLNLRRLNLLTIRDPIIEKQEIPLLSLLQDSMYHMQNIDRINGSHAALILTLIVVMIIMMLSCCIMYMCRCLCPCSPCGMIKRCKKGKTNKIKEEITSPDTSSSQPSQVARNLLGRLNCCNLSRNAALPAVVTAGAEPDTIQARHSPDHISITDIRDRLSFSQMRLQQLEDAHTKESGISAVPEPGVLFASSDL